MSLQTIFSDIAEAIRQKKNSTDLMKPSEMAENINSIETSELKSWQRLAIVGSGRGTKHVGTYVTGIRESPFAVTFPKPFDSVPLLYLATSNSGWMELSSANQTVNTSLGYTGYSDDSFGGTPWTKYLKFQVLYSSLTATGFSGIFKQNDTSGGVVPSWNQSFNYRAIKW